MTDHRFPARCCAQACTLNSHCASVSCDNPIYRGAGGLAIVLGLIAAVKQKQRLGYLGAALGAVAACLSIFVPMAQW